jgi:hypothetical protein
VGQVEGVESECVVDVTRHVCGMCEHDGTNGFVGLGLRFDGEHAFANLTESETDRVMALLADALRSLRAPRN